MFKPTFCALLLLLVPLSAMEGFGSTCGVNAVPPLSTPSHIYVAGRVIGCDGPIEAGMFNPSAISLCDGASGWRICRNASDAATQGLTTALCAATRNFKFYATQQRGSGNLLCDGTGANDIFGCGNGLGMTTPTVGCEPLLKTASNLFQVYNGTQWSCSGCTATGLDELETIHHFLGSDAEYDGGVMCCRDAPQSSPSQSPSDVPTNTPTRSPSNSPTRSPSNDPSVSPTKSPSQSPTRSPTGSPTKSPSKSPSTSPTYSPTESPSASPTLAPTACYNNIPLYETDNVGKSGKFRLKDPCDPSHCILVELKRIEEYNCSSGIVDPSADKITSFSQTNWTFNNTFYEGNPLIPVLTSTFEKVYTFPKSSMAAPPTSKKGSSKSKDSSKKSNKKGSSKKKNSKKGATTTTTTMAPSYNVTVDVDVLYFHQRGDFIPVEIKYGCCDAIDVEKNGLKFDVRIKGWKFQSKNNCLRVKWNFKLNNCTFPKKPSSSSSSSSDDARAKSKSASSSKDGTGSSGGKRKKPWYARYGSGSQSKSSSKDSSSKKKKNSNNKKKMTKDGRKISAGVKVPFDSFTYLRTPDVGYFDGLNETHRRPVHVQSTQVGGVYSVVFGFPYFNESVYYDPMIVLNPNVTAPPTGSPTDVSTNKPSGETTSTTSGSSTTTTTSAMKTTSTQQKRSTTTTSERTTTTTTSGRSETTTKKIGNGASNGAGTSASESLQQSSSSSSPWMWVGIGASILVILFCVGLYVWNKKKEERESEEIWDAVSQRDSTVGTEDYDKKAHHRNTSQQGLVTHMGVANVQETIDEDEAYDEDI